MMDLSDYEIVFQDDFSNGLNAYRNGRGLWSTSPRRDDLMTNGPQSVFLSNATTTADGQKIGLNPLSVRDGALHIGSGVIPEAKRDLVEQALADVGRAGQADDVKYYTGMVSTSDTWAQAYGYYEITAQIPVGKGHWPAFWLAPAGIGWPPEIDIFEAYSKGVGGNRNGNDNSFTVATFFDRYDTQGNPTQSVNWRNPHDLDARGNPAAPVLRDAQGGQQYMFQDHIRVGEEFGGDLNDGTWTWGAEWTPDYIAFYFGRDRDSMVEIYRTPVPDDLTTPMYAIINDQISSTWGWNPVQGLDHLTFARGNDFIIDSVSVYARDPDHQITARGNGAVILGDERSQRITGSRGNDTITTGGGAGQDFVDLSGGRDVVFFTRGTGNAIISDFGPDDRLVLEGFNFDGAAGVMARLTQVGRDVWLANGAYPADPQTVIFRDARVQDFDADQFLVRWSQTPDVWSSLRADSRRLRDTDGDGVVRAGRGGSLLDDTSRHDGPVTLRGGAGGDMHYVYRADTIIREAAGHGVDTVLTARSHGLSRHVENLTALDNAQGITLTGNAADNQIEGNRFANTLQGGAGDDLIISHGADRISYARGDGNDVISGFDGRDQLHISGYATDSRALLSRLVRAGDDMRLELEPGSTITFRDTTRADFNADSFRVTAAGLAPDAPGRTRNTFDDDSVRGDAGNNVIRDQAGNDRLFGLDGDDWLQGGQGQNHLEGGNGNDTLLGQGVNDKLFGGAGADTFVIDTGSSGTLIADLTAQDRLDISRFVDDLANVRLTTKDGQFIVSTFDGEGWDKICRVRTEHQQDVWDALIMA